MFDPNITNGEIPKEEENFHFLTIAKADLKQIVKERIVTITFLKLDNTKRVMRCTLLKEHLPEKDMGILLQEQTNERKVSEEVLCVWDLDQKGWRTFRLDRILEVVLDDI